jgi:histidinol-phosphatase (PHP family)
MKANYHTHHELCGHARGKCEDYVQEAIKNGLSELGFSDHAPNSRVEDYGVRMKPQDFTKYLEDIEYVQEKYKNQLTILKGIEVEFFYDHEEYYQFLKEKTDYMILGQHYISKTKQMDNLLSGFACGTDEEIQIYANYVCEGMKTGYFDILAHPDLYMCGYKNWNKKTEEVAHQIIRCAMETKTILEFNANGFRRGKQNTPQGKLQPYPRMEFWNIVKQYDVQTIFGVDCHTPEQLYDDTMREVEEVFHKLKTKSITFLHQKRLKNG